MIVNSTIPNRPSLLTATSAATRGTSAASAEGVSGGAAPIGDEAAAIWDGDNTADDSTVGFGSMTIGDLGGIPSGVHVAATIVGDPSGVSISPKLLDPAGPAGGDLSRLASPEFLDREANGKSLKTSLEQMLEPTRGTSMSQPRLISNSWGSLAMLEEPYTIPTLEASGPGWLDDSNSKLDDTRGWNYSATLDGDEVIAPGGPSQGTHVAGIMAGPGKHPITVTSQKSSPEGVLEAMQFAERMGARTVTLSLDALSQGE